MHTRRISRLRPHTASTTGQKRWHQIQIWAGGIFLLAAFIVVGYGMWWAPDQFSNNKFMVVSDAFNSLVFPLLVKVEDHWVAQPWVPQLQTGDELEVRQVLEQQPLIVAVFDRFESRTLWMREGDRLLKAREDQPKAQIYHSWIAKAEMSQLIQWKPPSEQDPDQGRISSIVFRGDRWIIIKRWKPGSPEVERALRLAVGANTPIQVGLRILADRDKPKLPRKSWGAPPALQADQARLNDSFFSMPASSTFFGDEWELVGIPNEKLERSYVYTVRRQRWLARGLALAVAISMCLGLYLRWRARKRALLDADRMASLTHSLKTPLAILKFRCDSLRLGRLTADQADVELLKIGQEVDDLTRLIEASLQAMQAGDQASPQSLVDPTWLKEVAEDIEPAFQAEHRLLEVRLGDILGKASLSSLRSGLATLLENALYHGEGKVVMETRSARKRLLIQISDEGSGLEITQLEAIGRPFLRLREQGQEGFRREGQGLGLSLLCRVAEREGWGLSFASAPGKGFHATLEIPIL